ncbi:MAG: penicillin-binding protein activator [Pseudomonadota bacterium]
MSHRNLFSACLTSGLALCVLFAGSASAENSLPVESAAVLGESLSLQADLQHRAEAQFATGDISGGIRSHLVLEAALTGVARSNNRDALWQALNALPASTDFSAVTEPAERGWVDLMQLVKSGAPLSAFEDWRRRYPDHPGESQIAAGLATASVLPAPSGRSIALLLPITGPLAPAAKAIKAGADAAQSQAGRDAPAVVVHDTAPGLDAALAAAGLQGTSALIGPLRKEEVAALAQLNPTVATITLNYLDGSRRPPQGMVPFGLAPEDEARAAADHAAGASLLRAVILAQEGDWGQRTAAAFKAQFELRGGMVLTQETFRPGSVDFTGQLKRVLGISYSEERGKLLATTGVKADLQPSPRGDIDVVYLAARSAQAKLIWPQMRYLRAGRIATYAPAAAADAGNKDLGRLIICDAPWRLETSGPLAALRGTLASVNPRSADAQRLFALGFDAYELSRRLVAGAFAPDVAIPGLTGSLVLEADGAMHRQLSCEPLYAPSASDAAEDQPQ